MKRILVLFLCVASLSISAQEFKGLDKLPMKSDADFKQAEPTVKDCAKYILSHPLDDKDESAKNAARFMVIWMTGTPDYSFSVDGDVVKFSKKNDGLTAVYMASMAKVVLDKPELAKDQKALKIAAFKLLAEYSGNSKNKVIQTADIKKLIEANKKGKVEDALDMSQIK